MRYSVYVLVSKSDNTRYIGITGKNPKDRLKDHNNGSNKYTRVHRPYELMYYEQDYCKDCALKREKFLKSGQGRRILDLIEQSWVVSSAG